MTNEAIANALREAAAHAVQLQMALVNRQRALYEFDETATRGKDGRTSPAVIVDQAEDIRRSVVQDVEVHLVPIVQAIADSDRVVSPLIDHVPLDEAKQLARDLMLLIKESREAAANLGYVEAALSRTSQLVPSNPHPISIARVTADEATDAMERARRSVYNLTEYLPSLAEKFADGPSAAPPVKLASAAPLRKVGQHEEKLKALSVTRSAEPGRAVAR